MPEPNTGKKDGGTTAILVLAWYISSSLASKFVTYLTLGPRILTLVCQHGTITPMGFTTLLERTLP